jgi:hypothetical protein
VPTSSPLVVLPRKVTYQKSGSGNDETTAIALPHGPQTEAEVRACLEDRLGPMAHVEVEQMKVRNTASGGLPDASEDDR